MKTRYDSLAGEQDNNSSSEGEQMTIKDLVVLRPHYKDRYHEYRLFGGAIKWLKRVYSEKIVEELPFFFGLVMNDIKPKEVVTTSSTDVKVDDTTGIGIDDIDF